MKEKFILISADGFVKEFWQRAKEHKTLISAYEDLEKEYKECFGKRRYSDYNSFRVCRDRKIKNKRNNVT
mgnify:CR=1 FL=1|tara:strand:+ start:1989 stop:2198 length:210 start_codon:yes stop_codon:yes gene_type:complete